MKFLRNFLNDKKSVRVASTIITILTGFYFLSVGLIEFNILAEIFAFDNYTLFRIEATLVGIVIIFVGYASYIQNRKDINKSFDKAKHFITEEAKELSEKAAHASESHTDTKKKSSKKKK